MTSFAAIALPPPLTQAIQVLGYAAMTPVQERSLPPLLKGKDVIAQARTGSGKTAAFGLGLLARIDLDNRTIQALVLCPTRELAEQVTTELRSLGRFLPNLKVVTLCGGVPVRTQTPSLEHSPHVVVGTPGRLVDHLSRKTLSLAGLVVLVLDEADRMLDMGFLESITTVVSATPSTRQTLLFSATFPPAIRSMSSKLQRSPIEITVDTTAPEAEIEQTFFEVEPEKKLSALVTLLDEHQPESALVFCHTRVDTRNVADQLNARGFSAVALHGELDQRDRDEVLLRFVHRSCCVLVATDVAARGLDIKSLPLVVSWELPIDPDVHVHRVGRTGRAGESGLAFSFVGGREHDRAEAIELRKPGTVKWGKLPQLEPKPPAIAPMITYLVEAGREDKLRPGDLLGALTGDLGLPGDAVGKIDILPKRSYVSIRREHAQALPAGKLKVKGRMLRISPLR